MAAPHQATVVSDRIQWRYAPLDIEVECSLAALETVRHEAVDGLTRLSKGGLEVGGFLLGRRTEGTMEIVGTLPIECEHKLGPLFILSTGDEKAFAKALTSDPRGGLQPVGLYVSHSRQGFSVAETDAKILDRIAPAPWQLVLVLIPAKLGKTRAGFFIRASIEGPFICVHEVMLSPLARRFEPPVPAAPVASAPPPVPLVPVVHDLDLKLAPATPFERIQSYLALEYRRWKLRQWSLTSTLALLVLFVIIGALVVGGRTPQGPAIPLHVSDLGSKLRIEWDPGQRVVRASSSALLEVRDGGHGMVTIPITRSGLDSGGALYSPQSDNVEVRLKLLEGNRTASESVLYFINNPSHPGAAVAASVPANVPANVPAGVPAALPKPAPFPVTAPATGSIPEESAPPPAARPVSIREKPARKTFQMPQTEPESAPAPAAPINLPDVPDIHASPAPPPQALASSSGPSIMALLTPSVRPPGPPQLHTGHLIWTGSLRKNATLTFSADGASVGVLNGRLPGVPVKVTVHPAELLDKGIAVYSKDGDQSGRTEQSANWNGWNVVIFHDWDPKKVAEAEVVEAPGPANNWKRLVVRNGNHSASVLVVDWQR